MVHQVRKEAFAAVAFVTFATLGFQSFPESVDEAGEGAACAGAAGATSGAGFVALAAVALMMDAVGRVTAVAQALSRKACSTLIAAFGLVVGRKWAFHAGHAEVIELRLGSLIVACGKRLGEIPTGSWLQPP